MIGRIDVSKEFSQSLRSFFQCGWFIHLEEHLERLLVWTDNKMEQKQRGRRRETKARGGKEKKENLKERTVTERERGGGRGERPNWRQIANLAFTGNHSHSAFSTAERRRPSPSIYISLIFLFFLRPGSFSPSSPANKLQQLYLPLAWWWISTTAAINGSQTSTE